MIAIQTDDVFSIHIPVAGICHLYLPATAQIWPIACGRTPEKNTGILQFPEWRVSKPEPHPQFYGWRQRGKHSSPNAVRKKPSSQTARADAFPKNRLAKLAS